MSTVKYLVYVYAAINNSNSIANVAERWLDFVLVRKLRFWQQDDSGRNQSSSSPLKRQVETNCYANLRQGACDSLLTAKIYFLDWHSWLKISGSVSRCFLRCFLVLLLFFATPNFVHWQKVFIFFLLLLTFYYIRHDACTRIFFQ